jgi:hypothetical protein
MAGLTEARFDTGLSCGTTDVWFDGEPRGAGTGTGAMEVRLDAGNDRTDISASRWLRAGECQAAGPTEARLDTGLSCGTADAWFDGEPRWGGTGTGATEVRLDAKPG